jgi:hypothetical protein
MTLAKSRSVLLLAWMMSVGCHGSSARIGYRDGAAGQGGIATGGGDALNAEPDASAPNMGTGGSVSTTSTTGTGGVGGSMTGTNAGGMGGGVDGDAGPGPDADMVRNTDAAPDAPVDAPTGGIDGGGASGTAGRSGSDGAAGERDDVGGPATGGRDGSADANSREVARGGIDAAADVAASSTDHTAFSVPQAPTRAVDILFVVDNSPSMDPKQQALAAAFPTMMTALQALPIGMPDLRVGVISTDMGAGAGEAGGNCAVVLGNQGLLWGNDPTADPNEPNNKRATTKAKSDRLGNAGCGMASGARWIEDVQGTTGPARSKNYVGNLPDVFSCLTSALGTFGCGYEHTLQSLRLALNPQPDLNPQNVGFLRRNAYLAVVIVTDEDDCSADPNAAINDKLFTPRLLAETASLRCAGRGHVCKGAPIPNYDPALGYTGTEPFVANFEDCDAKDDADPHNLPLIRVREFIDSVRQVKDRPDEQILVSGIIGWPKNGDLIGVQYRVDKDPTSMPVEQSRLWDYVPICSIPSVKSADGNIYKAFGGLRLKRFIDGFGANGRTYSICENDLAPVMTEIGNRIGYAVTQKLWPACIPNPLVDKNPSLPGLQPDCVIKDRQLCDPTEGGTCASNGYRETTLPQCTDGSGNPLDPRGPQLGNIPPDGQPCWYLVYDKDPNTGCPNAPQGQMIAVLRPTTPPAGASLSLSCRTCSSADDPRCLGQ